MVVWDEADWRVIRERGFDELDGVVSISAAG
jgi:hypothetical protein